MNDNFISITAIGWNKLRVDIRFLNSACVKLALVVCKCFYGRKYGFTQEIHSVFCFANAIIIRVKKQMASHAKISKFIHLII